LSSRSKGEGFGVAMVKEEVVLEETKGVGVCRLERFRVRVLVMPLTEC